MRIAALDLGSNSIKVTVADVDAEGHIQVVAERTAITRIGEGLDRTRSLSGEAMRRTLEGLKDLVDLATRHRAERIAGVGTAGLRGATNASEFLARVRAECGVDVEIIDGLREADLAFRVAGAVYGPGPVAVIDVGGRSTEVVFGQTGRIAAKVSLEIGSVRLTEQLLHHDPPLESELRALGARIAESYRAAPDTPPEATLVGVSGTVLSLMGLALGLEDIAETESAGEGRRLERKDLVRLYEDLKQKTTEQRIRGTVLPPGRADVIVAGVRIVLGALDRYGRDWMIASSKGVRHGLLHEIAGVTRPGGI